MGVCNCVDFVGEALQKAKAAGAIDDAKLKIFTDYKAEKYATVKANTWDKIAAAGGRADGKKK